MWRPIRQGILPAGARWECLRSNIRRGPIFSCGSGRQSRRSSCYLHASCALNETRAVTSLARHIPAAQLIIYPDAGHGSQYQYPELFLAHANLFLDQLALSSSHLFPYSVKT